MLITKSPSSSLLQIFVLEGTIGSIFVQLDLYGLVDGSNPCHLEFVVSTSRHTSGSECCLHLVDSAKPIHVEHVDFLFG